MVHNNRFLQEEEKVCHIAFLPAIPSKSSSFLRILGPQDLLNIARIILMILICNDLLWGDSLSARRSTQTHHGLFQKPQTAQIHLGLNIYQDMSCLMEPSSLCDRPPTLHPTDEVWKSASKSRCGKHQQTWEGDIWEGKQTLTERNKKW